MVQVVWEHNLTVPQKVNHRITILSNNSTKYIPQRIESRYSNRYLYANFHGSFMHDDQKMETVQMSISRLMDKQNMVYICTMEYYPGFQGDKIPIYAKIQMNLENIMLSEIKTQNTIYILFDSIYMKQKFL